MLNHSVVMVAPLSALSKRTRLVKMVQFLGSKGASVSFYGWERLANESRELAWNGSNVTEKVILKGGGYASRNARLMYPLWMVAVFFTVLFRCRRKTVFCLGWETAFPALLASFMNGACIVFDDADRFSMIVKLPEPFHRWLVSLEKWVSAKSFLHVVPSYSRYEWRNSNMYVLRNSPLVDDFESALSLVKPRIEAKLVLYANGWVGESRGAPIFLQLLNLASERQLDIAMVIAGRVDGPSSKQLLQHPLVHYVGEVTQKEALSWYASIDLLLTFYDPTVLINRKAESNKWGDAVYFGVPFVVNSEVMTASEFVHNGAAWSVPYNDAEFLFSLVETIINNKSLLVAAGKKCSDLKKDYPTFDEGVNDLVNRLIGTTNND